LDVSRIILNVYEEYAIQLIIIVEVRIMLFEILLAFVSMGILLAIGDFFMNLLPVCATARLERLFGLTKTE